MKFIQKDSNILNYPFFDDTKRDDSRETKRFIDYLENKKIIIFSPHLDDAILSMGSLMSYLSERGAPIDIYSFFTSGSTLQTNLTKKLLQQASIANAQIYFTTRKKEDQLALHSVSKSIHLSHIDFVDAAWRMSEGESPRYPDTTLNRYHKEDKKVLSELIAKLRSIKGNEHSHVFFTPLARGKHIDHLLVREATRSLFSPLIFYSDFPYSDKYPNEDTFIQEQQLVQLDWKENYYENKAKAIFMYESQTQSLFPEKNLTLPLEKFYFSPDIFLNAQ